MTPEFIQLLRDWGSGLFWIAVIFILSVPISIGTSRRKIVVECPHHPKELPARILAEEDEEDDG